MSKAGRRWAGLPWLALMALSLVACQATNNGTPPPQATKSTAEDRHEGYYYPAPGSREIYQVRAAALNKSGRQMRVGFITALGRQQVERPYAPRYAIFAKGDEAEKMIIVSLERGYLHTLYQARGLLAQLTAIARASPLFQQIGVQDYFTFFDLAGLLGFRRITISDGDTFAHQISLQ
ncbi:MAG TPA: molybdopterin-guanine dinucleotide biosynthesis protein A [Alphaproteobacteria bacterium]|jgi:hypothetical protein|nr:molybdopterin-guanine dinucleotide biosynthesis protein A [Alphaproteobacteria bacterium]